MRLYFIFLYIPMVMLFASHGYAGMFGDMLKSVKKSTENAIGGINDTVHKQIPQPAKETKTIREPVKTTPESVKSYDPVLVKKIQTQLNRLGYGPKKADGIYGDGTRRAIQNFEKQQGLAVTGVPTLSLLSRMDQAVQAETGSNPGSPTQTSANSGAEISASGRQKSENAEPLANTEEGESVYENCVDSPRLSRQLDCRCLAQKVVELRAKRGPEPLTEHLLGEISVNGSCRNIPGTTRMEYATCMRGTGIDYRGIPPEDYCECYARTWGKLYGEYEGKIDENKKSSIRLKARVYCYKPGAYKDK